MPEEAKLKFETTNPLYPVMVRFGSTIHDKSKQTVLFWRDYLRFFVHPEFYCPDKPQELRDLISEYSQRTRDLASKLLQGITRSLGMEEDYIQKAMDLDHGTQIFAANYYPPCPQPELAIGIPPHTDHGLLTFLLQNGVGGLEIQYRGQWFHVNALPNPIFVNTADQLEVYYSSFTEQG
ncbi:2-oxoglutarate-dependent dioxygenase 19-like [Coffea arabica]|uniref:2-oxoglutarate-dependent dioxygenase 19-like n=1 Tax=Coffea arabica TaxID=13443 RepID=A0A6P6VJT4_COFAR|nr:protein DOWNY MILDEW RESISTANCE 6-like [Coffea arabica]